MIWFLHVSPQHYLVTTLGRGGINLPTAILTHLLDLMSHVLDSREVLSREYLSLLLPRVTLAAVPCILDLFLQRFVPD